MRRAKTESVRFFLHPRSRLWRIAAAIAALCLCLASQAQDKVPALPTAATQAAPAGSQTAPAPAAAAPAAKLGDQSKEAIVYDKLYTKIRQDSDGTGTRQTTARIRVLADAGVKQMAVLTFTYTASNQQIDIGYVRVVKPDGSVVVTPDYNVQDMPADVTREAPMYSDIHQKHVAVRGLGVGDTLEYQVMLHTIKSEVPGQFWLEYSFEKNLIVLDEQLDLDLPADKQVTVACADVQPAITTADGRKLYHWSSSNLARPDPDAPPKSTKNWKPSVQVTTFSSWEQVGAWYNSLQKDSLTTTPAIQARADALTKGLTTDEDKLHAIFNDVALHIHYVGLDFGIGRYQPHAADDVLSNEYGDCKDKHTLLAALLKAAGIEAWPVLISSSRYLDPATPSPAQFDHVITLVPLGGKLLWMDSTEEVAPVGVLFATLRDKQALAIPVGKPAYLVHTPADLPAPRSIRIRVEGKLSDQGLFTGHLTQTADGDVGMLFRAGFRQTPQSQWKELLQRVAVTEGYGGEVSNPQVSEVEQIDQPLSFSFDYTREKYYRWNDQETSHWISPPLPAMGGELAPGDKEKKPADDIELGSTGKTVYLATMQLPTGWSMIPPQNVDLKEDWLEYHSTYSFSFKDGTFKAERIAVVKKTKVPLEQWEKYLALRRGMFEDWNNQILISPPSQTGARDWKGSLAVNEAPQILPGQPFDPGDAARLGQQLNALLPLKDAVAVLESDTPPSSADIAKAVAISRKAVDDFEAKTLTLPAEDAHSLYWAQMLGLTWSTLGWASLEAGDLPTAENYLRSACRLSQDRLSCYQLGRLLEAKGDKTGAAHLYELAHVSTAGNSLGAFLYSDYRVDDRIMESYRKLTGKVLTATPLNHGQYNGSLRAEMDKDLEIHGFTKTSKLNGEALFTVAYEVGKPVKAYFLNGDKGFAPMASTLEGHRFQVTLPTGTRARVLREVRLICAPFGGCDAYMLLPTSIEIPSNKGTMDLAPPHSPPGTKIIHIPTEP
jgi:tetratricopeptide (TPR) repeat protein